MFIVRESHTPHESFFLFSLLFPFFLRKKNIPDSTKLQIIIIIIITEKERRKHAIAVRFRSRKSGQRPRNKKQRPNT